LAASQNADNPVQIFEQHDRAGSKIYQTTGATHVRVQAFVVRVRDTGWHRGSQHDPKEAIPSAAMCGLREFAEIAG